MCDSQAALTVQAFWLICLAVNSSVGCLQFLPEAVVGARDVSEPVVLTVRLFLEITHPFTATCEGEINSSSAGAQVCAVFSPSQ